MKTPHNRTVLAVDDDEINLMILVKGVQEAGYGVKSFASGEAAWEYLQQNPHVIDIALLDKMMPVMSGLELLRRIKESDSLHHIPVIIQTGDAGVTQMREGLENGAYYYLTKPFHPEILEAILHSAENECEMRKDMLEHMKANQTRFVSLMQEGTFILKTHAEARLFAATLANTASYPEFVALGVMELLANAIEHGNLDIGYEQKSKLLLAKTWEQELSARAENPKYGQRAVHIQLEKMPSGFHLVIKDEGKGFDWKRYMHDHDSALNLNEPNGRGIAKAMIMLDDLHYVGNGNEVHCNVGLSDFLAMLRTSAKTAAGLHN